MMHRHRSQRISSAFSRRISFLLLLPLPCFTLYFSWLSVNRVLGLESIGEKLLAPTYRRTTENDPSSVQAVVPPDKRTNENGPSTSSAAESGFQGRKIVIPIAAPTPPPAPPKPRRPLPRPYKPYHELAYIINKDIGIKESRSGRLIENSYPAYNPTTAKPVPDRKLCKETCCVEAVAIPIDQDDTRIINTEDGKDLADVRMEQHSANRSPHLQYFASNFKIDLVPCFLPGTIIQIDNHNMALKYFWLKVRPLIQVPFILVTSSSDDNTPVVYQFSSLKDPLLIRYYGTNPIHTNFDVYNKLVPMHLGLSYQHPQPKLLQPYMKLNNYQNPFSNLDRFNLTKYPFDWEEDVFVHFGLHRTNRQKLWQVLCPQNSTDIHRISCHAETNRLTPDQIYSDMSHYRFGISPTGEGYDCYRTYEMLILGVIPIIPERAPSSYELFQDLPVIQMRHLDYVTSKDHFVQVIESYLSSPAFREADFNKGWQRMFMKYQRRQILKHAERDKEIFVDENGKEYYQGYRYTTNKELPDIFCADEGSCEYQGEEPTTDAHIVWESPKLTPTEERWLAQWKASGTKLARDLPN